MRNNYRDDYKTYTLRFGEVAVEKKFITSCQMEEAFSEQVSSYPSTLLRPHKIVGEILIEKGWMTFEQVLAVLEELTLRQRSLSMANTADETCSVISYSLPDYRYKARRPCMSKAITTPLSTYTAPDSHPLPFGYPLSAASTPRAHI